MAFPGKKDEDRKTTLDRLSDRPEKPADLSERPERPGARPLRPGERLGERPGEQPAQQDAGRPGERLTKILAAEKAGKPRTDAAGDEDLVEVPLEKYPAYRYHKDNPPVIVNSETEDKALGGGYSETPIPYEQPQREVKDARDAEKQPAEKTPPSGERPKREGD